MTRRRHLTFVVILGGLISFGPLSIDMYLPAFPDLTRQFDAGASEIQLTLTACLLGLATGQLLAGPLSDTHGRRRPLFVGLACYIVTSILCAIAPNVWLLVLLRFLQGFSAAAGIVISRAVARDLFSGADLARFFAMLLLVNGLAPILAPIIGSQVLTVTSWRGVFVVLGVIGALLLVASVWKLPETHLTHRRLTGGIRTNLAVFRRLMGDRVFMGYALSSGFIFAAMFAYIAGSPFVLQEIHDLSPTQFSVCFGSCAFGFVVAAQVSARLVRRVGPERLLTGGLMAHVVGGLALLVCTLAGAGLWGVLVPLFVMMASTGFVGPNAQAMALASHGAVAGSASALLGVIQFLIGAIITPLVGIAGTDTALPMALAMALLGVAGLTVRRTLAPPQLVEAPA